jgi:hypothetical protein
MWLAMTKQIEVFMAAVAKPYTHIRAKTTLGGPTNSMRRCTQDFSVRI